MTTLLSEAVREEIDDLVKVSMKKHLGSTIQNAIHEAETDVRNKFKIVQDTVSVLQSRQDGFHTRLQAEFEKEFKAVNSKILKLINRSGKQVIMEEIKKIDIPQTVIGRFENEFAKNFKPVVEESIRIVSKYMTARVNERLKQIVSLKTSTIQEVEDEMNKIPVELEKEIPSLLEQFPEYNEAIKKTRLLVGGT